MIGFMGWDMTQAERDELHDETEAFFAYIEDPDSDLALVLAVEEALEVVHP
ncbi:hypothetical protein KGG73_gp32 [Streptomyces phage Sentinel]|uniref:Uncharacterized protein n=1 Tax=Streptomyces phage Sentinel TaxID=2767584 RepID=A0A873WK41_9CAUD|nr:hypothetical protein KGG73_gp32 [Streptomyces phage Sentinel]QPB09866.1 hypothetical protein CPT_Sentinel_032 [Streptomyces phage Sentinel]